MEDRNDNCELSGSCAGATIANAQAYEHVPVRKRFALAAVAGLRGALAHLFGGRDTELVRKVEFEPGSHDLVPAEQGQLALLARALGERPALDLIVFGPYDAALDDRALREHAVRESVAAALGRAPVAFGDPDTQRVLDALAAARLGSETRVELNAADAAKGRSYYAVVFDALVAHTQLSSTELQLLAANRAKAITQELLQSGLDPERVAGSQIGAVVSSAPGTVEAMLDLRPGSQ